MLAQQDNPPGRGQVPTDSWTPGAWVRDPYTLWLPEDAGPGPYRLLVGLYDANGTRAPLTLPGGATADALEIPVVIEP